MSIQIRPTGEAKAVAQAGRQIGRAKAAEKQQQLTLEQQAREEAKAWEIQKFVLNSQQQFAHEMRLRQAELNKEARAHEWEVEKAELASRMDFEQEERDRLRDKATFNAGIEAITNDKTATNTQKDAAKFNLATKYTHIPEAAPYLGLKPTSTGLFNFGGEEAPPLPGTPVSTVNNPLGLNIENIPVAKLPEAVLSLEAQNKFEVISPEGKTETIDANQWPEKKAQGYVLATIKRLQTTKALRRAAQASYPKIQP